QPVSPCPSLSSPLPSPPGPNRRSRARGNLGFRRPRPPKVTSRMPRFLPEARRSSASPPWIWRSLGRLSSPELRSGHFLFFHHRTLARLCFALIFVAPSDRERWRILGM
uniref:Uncharacterized protein n=1 Tax=Aegilops tauschii subsp. strangulata TaxID=200361 RepID=A0A453N000_AEGTS